MGEIERQVALHKGRWQRGPRPPGQRLDAGHKLGDSERLGQVVLRANPSPSTRSFDAPLR